MTGDPSAPRGRMELQRWGGGESGSGGEARAATAAPLLVDLPYLGDLPFWGGLPRSAAARASL